MGTLAQPPLLEAIFELRWGMPQQVGSDLVRFRLDEDDQVFFVGQFRGVAASHGFSTHERTNQPLDNAVHVVTHRFRPAPAAWPCLQIGLGIMTVNQVNDGYDWPTFRDSILKGVDILNSGHPKGLAGLSGVGVELKYQDGFLFEDNERAADFLTRKLNFGFEVPQEILTAPEVKADTADGYGLTFHLRLVELSGILFLNLQQVLINGRPGFVMETAVRSAGVDAPKLSRESLIAWLEAAHRVQQRAFASFIKPAYSKSFQ